MLPWGLLSVNEVAFLILTLPPPFIGGQSPSSFDNDKTIDADGDDTILMVMMMMIIRLFIHGGGDDTNIDGDANTFGDGGDGGDENR